MQLGLHTKRCGPSLSCDFTQCAVKSLPFGDVKLHRRCDWVICVNEIIACGVKQMTDLATKCKF